MLTNPRRLLVSIALLAALLAAPAAARAAAPVGVGHSGWAWGNPTPQGESLRHLEFAGGTGYAAGDFGTVLRTRDAGATWTALPSPTNRPLLGVRAVSASEVVVWTACSAWRSTTSGATFTRIPIFSKSSGCDPDIAGVAFSAAAHGKGFFVLSDGSVRETLDGGRTFTGRAALPGTPAAGGPGGASAAGVDLSPSGVLLADVLTGFAGTIVRSANDGQSWAAVDHPAPATLSVRFAGASRAYAVGSDSLEASDDGGVTWTSKSLPDEGYGDVSLTDVACAQGDPDLCLFSQAHAGQILRTADGGTTVTSILPAFTSTYDVGFATATAAVTVGDGGLSLASADGGATFRHVSGALGTTFTGLRATSRTGAAAFGARGVIARTGDAGATWSLTRVPTTSQILDVGFSSFQTGYALLDGGGVESTDNGGQSWAPKSGDVTGSALLATGKSVVLVAGRGGVRRSADGAGDFSAVGPRYALTRLDRAGAAVVASGAGHIIVSTDTGRTWRKVKAPSRRSIAAVDFQSATRGYVVDGTGTLFTTASGGKHWTALRAAGATHLSRISFADAKHGWAGVASRKGTLPFGGDYVLYTANGGASWRPQVVTDQGPLSFGALAPGRAVAFTADTDLFTSTASGGDVRGATSLTLKTSRRKLRRGARVRITGKLKGARAGDVVFLERYASGTWTRAAFTLPRSGTFTYTATLRRDARYVAQFGGDGTRRGAGSAAVLVKG